MCRCTPSVRTPYCGAPGCKWPQKKNENLVPGVRKLADKLLSASTLLQEVAYTIEARDHEIGLLTEQLSMNMELLTGTEKELANLEEQYEALKGTLKDV